ncbi:TatD family hydrolase [Microbacterium resistens]|uniref:TatD family hydrolase n=1 Tax=Microbacterium resistens TaxID=156977 RepID=UPI000831341E|nr:TatD family hydrolase [Microbacterium resistens]MBW1639525.1 TatD family hydrolase [Microbacterium resistens]
MTHPDTYVRERSADGRKDLRYPPAPEPLAVPVYDNHCHLEIEDGDDPLTLAEQLDRAEAVGIAGVVQASGDIESSRWAVAAAEADRRVLAAVAIHPNDAPTYAAHGRLDEALAVIDELAAHPRTRAIGETGLDYFRTGEDGRAAQHTSFEAHIALAKKHRLAMQIHDRDAHDDVLATLSRVGAPERTVFHCFSGDDAMARTCADAGYYLSFAGTVTFKNAQNLRDALRVTPLDRILVETDAPFLAPVPLRGRPNAPYLIPITLRFMAAELGLDPDALAAQVAENTRAVYGAFD